MRILGLANLLDFISLFINPLALWILGKLRLSSLIYKVEIFPGRIKCDNTCNPVNTQTQLSLLSRAACDMPRRLQFFKTNFNKLSESILIRWMIIITATAIVYLLIIAIISQILRILSRQVEWILKNNSFKTEWRQVLAVVQVEHWEWDSNPGVLKQVNHYFMLLEHNCVYLDSKDVKVWE